jgi:4-hydroxy-2-oxoheptanedioate aldolase
MQKRDVSFGLYLNFLCPQVIELSGQLGFEWLFLDAERLPLPPHASRELVRAADMAGLPCLVRVPELEPSVIAAFLDMGVRGILAPRIGSAHDAHALVAAVKFRPAGQGYRHGNQIAAALVETRSGLDHLDEIAAVPGLDYIAIGPNDLGRSIGIADGLANPLVRELVERAQAQLRALGKPQVAVASDVTQTRAALAAGATLVAVPDSALLAGAARAFLGTLRPSSSAD